MENLIDDIDDLLPLKVTCEKPNRPVLKDALKLRDDVEQLKNLVSEGKIKFKSNLSYKN